MDQLGVHLNDRIGGPFLTGITHNDPLAKSHDIFKDTCDLVKKYIEEEEMLILVVIPADSDFQNAAVLKLANDADPDGKRTLGVVTKVRRQATRFV